MASKEDLKEIVKKYISENYSKKEIGEGYASREKDSKKTEGNVVYNPKTKKQDVVISGKVKSSHDKYDDALDALHSDKSFNESVDSEIKKIDDAISHFEKKIASQGRITNARDEEHLEKLKDLRSKMSKESIDEMSTTAAAPAPATKYAFKRKK